MKRHARRAIFYLCHPFQETVQDLVLLAAQVNLSRMSAHVGLCRAMLGLCWDFLELVKTLQNVAVKAKAAPTPLAAAILAAASTTKTTLF